MKPFAPDKDQTFPKPKPTGNGGGNGGGKGAGTIGFAPGQINAYVEQQVSAYGGDPEKWRQHFKDVYTPVRTPSYSWEKGNGGGGNGGGKNVGGGKDPTKPGTQPQPWPYTPSHANNRMAPITQGFLNVNGPAASMPPTMGLLRQPPPAGAQTQLPPEILAMMTRR
jgi:hypothetical protein